MPLGSQPDPRFIQPKTSPSDPGEPDWESLAMAADPGFKTWKRWHWIFYGAVSTCAALFGIYLMFTHQENFLGILGKTVGIALGILAGGQVSYTKRCRKVGVKRWSELRDLELKKP